MFCCHVVNQFLDKNCFTYAGAAEQTDFTTLCIGGNEVNDFNAGFKNFSCRRLVFKGRCRTMNRPVVGCRYFRIVIIHGFAKNVENTSEAAVTNRCRNSTAGIYCFHSTYHAVCGTHCNGADYAVTKVLHGFTNNIYRNIAFFIFDMNCVINSG